VLIDAKNILQEVHLWLDEIVLNVLRSGIVKYLLYVNSFGT
jgi:hypothetical protein